MTRCGLADFVHQEIWDDGWGEEEEIDGKKGEGIRYGRVGCQDL